MVLSSDKVYLVESRLMPVARRHGIASLDDLLGQIRDAGDSPLMVEVTEAMMTNESYFFRDRVPFESFRQNVLPTLLEARRAEGASKIRVWSAACSSGQEPYSLAMILKEEADKLAGFEVEIVATDLSTSMIEKAKSGIYTQFEVQRGLPIQLLVKYFKQVEEDWQIDAVVRETIDFRPFNLLEGFGALGKFDVVFCRNVLIYFDQPTKSDILQRISTMLPNDGILCLGAAESVLGISKDFKPVQGLRGVYGLVEADFSGAAELQASTG